jgi:hypothetical protein
MAFQNAAAKYELNKAAGMTLDRPGAVSFLNKHFSMAYLLKPHTKINHYGRRSKQERWR